MSAERMMHALPVEAYTSREWYDREQAKIFSNVWRFAGFMEDISTPGQYISVQAGLNNIFIVMGRDRRLRAFHNICRHRGTQLLRAVGKTQKAITCPYHDWTYDLEGSLQSVPKEKQEFAGLDKRALGLKAASVDIWRTMLFVHPDPDAEPITTWFAGVEQMLGPHKVEDLVEYKRGATSHTIKANWKIVVENYIDVYHLAHLHSGTLAMYDHAKAEYGFAGPHYHFREPLAPHYAENIESNAMAPLILPKDKLGAWVPMLFPGLGLAENESTWSTFHVIPLAPDLTRVETRTRLKDVSSWRFLLQGWKSYSFWSAHSKPKMQGGNAKGKDDPLASGDFMAEDIYACEQQQKSLSSPNFEVGPSASSGEQPVRRHQEIVLEFLERE